MIRLAVCSKQHVFRAGLRCLVKSWELAESITECESIAKLASHLATAQPDVAILEICPEFDLHLLEEVRAAAPQCRLLLLAGTLAPELLYHITESKLHSVVSVNASVGTFLDHLQCVIDGRCRVDPAVLPAGAAGEKIALTQREGELVSLLAQGLKNKEIATALNISEGTVKVYLSRLFQKVHVKDRFELALFGLKNMSVLGGGLMKQERPAKLAPAVSERGGTLILDWNHPPSGRMRTPVRRREAAVS